MIVKMHNEVLCVCTCMLVLYFVCPFEELVTITIKKFNIPVLDVWFCLGLSLFIHSSRFMKAFCCSNILF